jgi:SAM-dependent methyltransferase
MSHQFWDERYRAHETVYGEQPNTFFKEQLDLLTPGELLLPAEGEGRNAFYAAAHDWRVTAFDYSATARTKALDRATRSGLSLRYSVAEIQTFEWPVSAFDVVGLVFIHVPTAQRTIFHQHCVSALKPGGRIILEAFAPGQLAFSSGGPKDPDMLYALENLKKDFQSLEFIHAYETRGVLNEGPFHQGEADLVRLVGIKPKM